MAAHSTFSCPLLTGEVLNEASIDISDIENEAHGVQAVTSRLGFCIVKNVLTSEECSAMERLMGQDLCEVVDEKSVAASNKTVQDAWSKAKEQVIKRVGREANVCMETCCLWKCVWSDTFDF